MLQCKEIIRIKEKGCFQTGVKKLKHVITEHLKEGKLNQKQN